MIFLNSNLSNTFSFISLVRNCLATIFFTLCIASALFTIDEFLIRNDLPLSLPLKSNTRSFMSVNCSCYLRSIYSSLYSVVSASAILRRAFSSISSILLRADLSKYSSHTFGSVNTFLLSVTATVKYYPHVTRTTRRFYRS